PSHCSPGRRVTKAPSPCLLVSLSPCPPLPSSIAITQQLPRDTPDAPLAPASHPLARARRAPPPPAREYPASHAPPRTKLPAPSQSRSLRGRATAPRLVGSPAALTPKTPTRLAAAQASPSI